MKIPVFPARFYGSSGWEVVYLEGCCEKTNWFSPAADMANPDLSDVFYFLEMDDPFGAPLDLDLMKKLTNPRIHP